MTTTLKPIFVDTVPTWIKYVEFNMYFPVGKKPTHIHQVFSRAHIMSRREIVDHLNHARKMNGPTLQRQHFDTSLGKVQKNIYMYLCSCIMM